MAQARWTAPRSWRAAFPLWPLVALLFLPLQQSAPLASGGVQVTLPHASLKGAGAHREIHYVVSAAMCSSSQLNYEGTAAVHCQAELVQPLPAGVFVDPYELSSHASREGVDAPEVRGEVDLESPEQESSATVVHTTLQLSVEELPSPADGCSGQSWLLQGSTALPVHSRYPVASFPNHASDGGAAEAAITGMRRWIAGPMIAQHISLPEVKIICSAGSVPPTQNASLFANITLLDDNKAEGDPAGGMVWMVPAGNLGHTALVGHATAVLLAFCTVAIAYSAFRFRL